MMAVPDHPDSGVLLVDKPAGPTSHDVVDFLRWALRERSVGHCGTLDPAATGLLVVCVGAATRLARYFTDEDKTYRASFGLGASTDTADGEGRVVSMSDVHESVVARASETLGMLVGAHELPPPAFSAIRVDGQRAHALAREGRSVCLEPRPMVVHRVEDMKVERVGSAGAVVTATLQVSKGTYIRSLATLFGERLGVPCHLSSLRRLASGRIRVDQPGVMTGLQAVPRGGPKEGPPRWRIRPGEAPPDREGLGRWVATRLQPLESVMPMSVVRLDGHGAARAIVRRLGHGQAVELADPGWPPGTPRDARRLAIHGGGGWIVVRVEGEGPGLAAQPERVVVAPRLADTAALP